MNEGFLTAPRSRSTIGASLMISRKAAGLPVVTRSILYWVLFTENKGIFSKRGAAGEETFPSPPAKPTNPLRGIGSKVYTTAKQSDVKHLNKRKLFSKNPKKA
jgi:hypothetical protein